MSYEHRPKVIENNECVLHDRGAMRGKYSDRRREKSRLKFVIWITVITMAVEIAGGIMSGSMALISDAGHMFTDAFALSVSYFAIILSSRPADSGKTFGYYRIEILAALFNGVLMILVTAWIFYQAYRRIMSPVGIRTSEMLVIATVGFLVNLVSAVMLVGASEGDINLRSAFIHMMGDTVSSVAVIIGAVVIRRTGYTFIDPVLSVLIAVLILMWSFNLVKESLHILLEAVPKNIDIKKLRQEILAVGGVLEVRDLHIWTITSNMYSLTAHIRVKDGMISEKKKLLDEINCMLDTKFDILHTNIQFES